MELEVLDSLEPLDPLSEELDDPLSDDELLPEPFPDDEAELDAEAPDRLSVL